jgi:hypothetical protein
MPRIALLAWLAAPDDVPSLVRMTRALSATEKQGMR